MLGTLRRASDVLDLFTSDRPEWGVTEATRELGIPKSLTHDVMASLANIGLLRRVPGRRYRLGWRTVALAGVAVQTSRLKAEAAGFMCRLALHYDARVRLGTWDRGHIVYIAEKGRPQPGGSDLAGNTATALVLLAGCPWTDVEALIANGHWPGPALADDLHEQLARIRERGFACQVGAGGQASCAVAAPICDVDGQVIAALMLLVPPRRPSSETSKAVMRAATAISRRLRRGHELRAERPLQPRAADGEPVRA